MTYINFDAFKYCSGLKEVRSLILDPFELEYSAFPDITNLTLYVPAGTKSKYEVTNGWKNFKTIIEMEPESGDLNGDGNVDVGDIMAIINFMAAPSGEAGAYDLNGDGNVDVGDIMAIINIMAQ